MNVIHVLEPLASNAMAEKINELEHTIGSVLPSHFKDLLMQNNVCKPHKNHYKDKETEFTINYFLGFSENKNDDIIATYNDYEGRMPEELMPIASVDGGDWLCINKITGKVYYWFHKEDKREVVSVTYSPRLLKLINEKRIKDGLPPLEQ